MVLSSSKSGKPNDGDDRDDSANLTRPDMEAVGETEHVEHNKEGEDSGGLGQHEQHKITEEKPNGQSNEALQTVIALIQKLLRRRLWVRMSRRMVQLPMPTMSSNRKASVRCHRSLQLMKNQARKQLK